jgi:predicted RNA-binding Zn-ribbon protein involved in translation (DUF1610 family)
MPKEDKKGGNATYDTMKCTGCGTTFSMSKTTVAKNCPECGLLVMR